LLNCWVTGQTVDWGQAAIYAGAGAAAGALAGFTFGASLALMNGASLGAALVGTTTANASMGTVVAAGGISGAVGGATGSYLQQGGVNAYSGKGWGVDWRQVGVDTAAGAIGGVVTAGLLHGSPVSFSTSVQSGVGGGFAAGMFGGGASAWLRGEDIVRGAGLGALQGTVLGGAGGALGYGYYRGAESLQALRQTRATWKAPSWWVLPEEGTWTGPRGHSDFIPNNPEALGVPPGTRIPFRRGFIDLSAWAQDEFHVSGMKGTRADFPLIHQKLAGRLGLPNQTAAKAWLQQQGLSPHHAGGDLIQLVPRKLHGIDHMGGSWQLRNLWWGARNEAQD
jgi:hypothetical protein